ncbi:MAG: hypothetical protein JXR95_14090 [Deltaproteobacteria bacterium]|nr:hypothetical protein [Deltaproteobacteria bacterium]
MRNNYFIFPIILILGTAILLFAGCTTDSGVLYLEYCIPVSVTSPYETPVDGQKSPSVGVVLDYTAYESAPLTGSDAIKPFVIASEIPVTIIEDSTIDSMDCRTEDIAIVDNLSTSQDENVAARVAFPQVDVFAVNNVSSFIPGGVQTTSGLIGGDLLRNFAVKFHYENDRQCSFLWDEEERRWPNVLFLKEQPADSQELADDGFGVVNYELSGGGSYYFNNAERDFSATRVVVRICAQPDPFPVDPENPEYAPPPASGSPGHYPVSGVDMLALVATGTVPLISTLAGVERMTNAIERTGGTVNLTTESFQMPEGAVEALRMSGLTRIALIGGVSSELGPCGELARRRGQEYGRRYPLLDDPYYEDSMLSGAAVLEVDLERGFWDDFNLLGIPATTDYWQGLWAETTPDVPQIDMILSHSFLSFFDFTIDYIQSRMILRCLRYDCSSNTETCCGAVNTECRCSPSDPCCQFYKFKK